MLSKPIHGWTEITIDQFCDRASYLTDVANDCLDSAIETLETGKEFRVYCDAEGWEYTIVGTEDAVWIETTKDSDELGVDCVVIQTNAKRIDLFRELSEDIKRDIEEWARWVYDPNLDAESLWQEERKTLSEKIEKLEALLAAA